MKAAIPFASSIQDGNNVSALIFPPVGVSATTKKIIINETWRTISSIQILIDSTWKEVTDVYVLTANGWKLNV